MPSGAPDVTSSSLNSRKTQKKLWYDTARACCDERALPVGAVCARLGRTRDAYYKRAQAVRARITADFTRVFSSGVHALFTPTTPTTAFALGAVADPYEMYLSDIFTVTANLAGIPAMSLPIGRVDGLPVGGQLLASHFDEAIMLRIAAVLEHQLGAEAHV